MFFAEGFGALVIAGVIGRDLVTRLLQGDGDGFPDPARSTRDDSYPAHILALP
jgi:hypothetical protein